MKEEKINPFEYNYEDDVMVEIPGTILHSLITYLRQVEDNETQVCFSHSYSISGEEHKDKDSGIVTHVDLHNKNYPSMNSYMNQQAIKATSMIGVMAFDFIGHLTKEHLKAIKDGKAKKQGSFETKKEEDESPLKLA